MPKALHDKLAKQAKQQGITGSRAKAYMYGTMAKMEKKKKGPRKP